MRIEIEYNGSYAVCKVDGIHFMDCDSLTQALTLDAFRTIEQHFYRENGKKIVVFTKAGIE